MFEPDRYVQDWYPIFIEISKADRISFINKPLYNYRIRENSITTKKTIKSIEDYSHAASQIIEYSQKHKLDSQSILIFKAITFNTIINRYYNYNLNIKNTNKMYSEIKRIVHYKHNLNKATLMLQDDYQRLVKKENKWGSVICQVSKIEPERKIDTFYYLYTKNNLLYTALPAVITTQYILECKTKIGLNCLCDSLNCQSFMSDLDFYGIKYSYYEHKN